MSNQLDLLSEGQFYGQNNREIEEIVLATFINFPQIYYDYADKINVKGFTSEETRYIYNALHQCSINSKIDIVIITDRLIQLKYTDRMREKNGFDLINYLNDICDRIENDQHIHEHVKLLMGYASRRRLGNLARKITEDTNNFVNPEDIINTINSELVNIQEVGEEDEFNYKKVLEEVVQNLQDKEGKRFIKTYVRKIDEFIFGWEESDFIIIAGAPSMGKTSFALEIARQHIIRGNSVGIFSLEMTKQQMMTRMIAAEATISLGRIRNKQLDDADWKQIHGVLRNFEGDNYSIDDKSGDLFKICGKIRKMYMKHNCKLFFIDYLQLVTVNIGRKGNREQEIAKISRTFKEIARELGVVIVALSQISRAVNFRSSKKPTLGDLRESGAIEQDADMVMFVYRDAYYNIEEAIPDEEEAEIIIAKGRSTGLRDIPIKFISKYTKFIADENSQAIQEYSSHFTDS